MNIAHIAYYANRVLQDLGMQTLTVAFWRGLWEGRGDTSVVPDEWLAEVEKELVAGMQRVFEDTKAEIQASLDDDWQQIKDIVTEGRKPVELPDGDIMLYCQHCLKQTQHTETETLPGGYPLYECVICDGGRIP